MSLKQSELLIIDNKKGRIYFKELTVEDVSEDYHAWMNDPEVVRYLEARFSDNSMQGIREFVTDCSRNPDSLFFAVRLRAGDKHIGNIKLHGINRIHHSAEVSIMIGDKSCWGKGYGQEAIRLLCDYAFCTLKLNKLSAECYANNPGSLKTFKKAGFKEEGRREKQYVCNDQYVDSYLLGLVRGEQGEG